MKKAIITALLILVATMASSQETYRSLVVEGKEWRYVNISDDQQDGNEYVALVIRGDTVIHGTAYKKLFLEDNGNLMYCAAIREYEKRIDFISYENDAVVHYYDFNLHDGDLINHEGATYKIFDEHYVDVLGGQFRVVELWREMSGGKYTSTDLWIEGIGNLTGLLDITGNWFPFVFLGGSNMGAFVSCYESGKCIFSVDEFMKQHVAFIKGITASLVVPSTYDLQGRRMAEGKPLHPGIYVKDGRKFVVKYYY